MHKMAVEDASCMRIIAKQTKLSAGKQYTYCEPVVRPPQSADVIMHFERNYTFTYTRYDDLRVKFNVEQLIISLLPPLRTKYSL